MEPIDLLRRAIALHQSGRAAEAEAAYLSVLAVAPDLPDAHNLLGVLRASTGRAVEATDSFARAVRRRPDVASFQANLGKSLAAAGATDRAEERMRRALALAPDGGDGGDILFSLGNLKRRAGRAGDAVRFFARVLVRRPDAVEVHNNLAAALDADGRAGEAIERLRLAVILAPDDGRTWFNLGRSEQAADEPEAAIAAYRRAWRAGADFETVATNLAHVLVRAGRAGEAVAVLRRTNALAPADADRLPHLAGASRDAGRFDEAPILFERAATLTPADPTPRQRLFEIAESTDRPDRAADILVETARLGRRGVFHPKNAYYHLVRRCNALIAEGRRDRVAPLLDHAERRLRDTDAEWRAWAVFLRGSLAAMEGDVPTARRLLAEAEPRLPFLKHVCLEDDFARRVEGPESEAERMIDRSLVTERRAAPIDGPLILAACDARYLRRFGPAFAATADRFAPSGARIHFHVVDPDPDTEALIEETAARSPRSRLGWSRESAPAGLSAEGRRAFLTCVRFIRLSQIAAEYRAPLLVADIDALFLGDPGGFIDALSSERPLALQYFPLNLARLYDGVGGGLIAARPEPAVIELFKRVGRFLSGWIATGDARYFLDQIALVAGLDDARRRGAAPGVIGLETRGRVFHLGRGAFVQILDEKSTPDFDQRAESLVRALRIAGPLVDLNFERSRILSSLGIPE